MIDFQESTQEFIQADEQSPILGRPRVVNDYYLDRLKQLVRQSPRRLGYPFEHWTAEWLRKHLVKETGVEVSNRHISRLLKQMGLSTRPDVMHLQHKRFGVVIGDLQSSQ